ncbi:endolytic transglycosylase MltG [Neptunitalea lumnitzerae]|uniref:Endolytic murein transglycosylase n=1 Tax=Neptunitalea lumnitzerae TaxID=2965509 RepID=A0ABQ5MK93_9FLAO|nr:endolytic transglycosylase MltG [Neptunitalea sp. Y10]GLB49814.1 aminodeoxychorismate lyase [Neptunitalea sp. Y10]
MNLKKLIAIVAILGVIAGGIFVYRIYNILFTPNTSFNNKEAHLYIESGDTFDDVKEQLSVLLTDLDGFVQVANRKGYSENVKAGFYIIKKGMTNNDIVNTLRVNNIPIRVTFNNQDTVEKLAGRIAVQIEADSLELLEAMTDSTFLAENNFTEETAIAMYIPNTYEFFWNTSASQFRERMLKEYHNFWNEERVSKAKELGITPMQVISLAAIVQKETAKVSERKRVAGVYMNRVKSNWLLEADPTVIYAYRQKVGDDDFVIKRVLNKHKEVTATSPYNTYYAAGIPPGPIAMPDISSIDAVLNYEHHDYYFFVADVSNFGYHKFAKTLSQHNANAALYHKWVARQNY